MADTLFQQAVELTRTGRREEARELFIRVLESDPKNEAAWLWYADSLDSLSDRIVALSECLEMIPSSKAAKNGLALLQEMEQSGEKVAGTEDSSAKGPAETETTGEETSSIFPLRDDPFNTGGFEGVSVSPFTVSPDEVTEEDIARAERNLITTIRSEGYDPVVERTQPIKFVSIKNRNPGSLEQRTPFDFTDSYSQSANTKTTLPEKEDFAPFDEESDGNESSDLESSDFWGPVVPDDSPQLPKQFFQSNSQSLRRSVKYSQPSSQSLSESTKSLYGEPPAQTPEYIPIFQETEVSEEETGPVPVVVDEEVSPYRESVMGEAPPLPVTEEKTDPASREKSIIFNLIVGIIVVVILLVVMLVLIFDPHILPF